MIFLCLVQGESWEASNWSDRRRGTTRLLGTENRKGSSVNINPKVKYNAVPANRSVSLLCCRLKTNLFTASYHILPTESYPLCSTHSNCSKIPSICHLGSSFTSCHSCSLVLCGLFNATVTMVGLVLWSWFSFILLFVILAIWKIKLLVLSNI